MVPYYIRTASYGPLMGVTLGGGGGHNIFHIHMYNNWEASN
jgi:hypothetical protein